MTPYATRSASDPADHGFLVTPSDTSDLVKDAGNLAKKPVDFLYIAVAGNLVFMLADGTVIGPYAVTAGQMIPFRATRVKATSTTATVIAGQHLDPT